MGDQPGGLPVPPVPTSRDRDKFDRRDRDELPTSAVTLAWALLLIATAGLVIFLLLGPSQPDSLTSPASLLPVGVVGLAAVSGPLLPRFTRWIAVPEARTWPVPFILALLFAWGLPAAMVLLIATGVVAAAVSRRPFAMMGHAIGRQSLGLVAAALIALLLTHDDPEVPGIVQPDNPWGLVVCLLAGTTFLAVDILLDGIRRAVIYAPSLTAGILAAIRARALVGAAHVALAPMFALVMNVSPWLTWLVFVPVASLHRSATASRHNAWAATHDGLTGLANRDRLTTATDHALAHPPTAGQVALLVLDLDGFKAVNDVLGHRAGDQVLREVAGRLDDTFGGAEVVARLGGDEFGLLVRVPDVTAARTLGHHVAQVLADPYLHDGEQMVDVDASIGIALAPDHAGDAETLLALADTAMYRAKDDRTTVEIFDASISMPTVSKLGIIGSLRRALETGELFLVFQPKVNLETRRLTGVEALVRWQHPSGVVVLPEDFIPAAERSGLMPTLTHTVLTLALQEVRMWRRNGLEVPVAVNVTSTDLLRPGFAASISRLLAEYRVPARNLTLEVTERVVAHDMRRAREVMVALNKLGVRLAMDDFGTGWSSLLMLRELPVSEVKLDRSFVSRAVDSDTDRAIVANVTELAHALDLVVVAEGVESEQVLDRLVRLGCDEAQGWHVATPMPADQVIAWNAGYLAELAADDLLRGMPRQGAVVAGAALHSLADQH